MSLRTMMGRLLNAAALPMITFVPSSMPPLPPHVVSRGKRNLLE